MTTDQLLKQIISKSVEKYGVDFDFIMANQFIGDSPWYQHYTHTQAEHDEWIEWSINLLSKKFGKKRARKEVIYVDLMWGLRIA